MSMTKPLCDVLDRRCSCSFDVGMVSLNLRPKVQNCPNLRGFEVAQSWGENKLSDNEPIGSKDPFFQRYGRINSFHNTNRRIKCPDKFQVFPWNDYQRTSDNGEHPLCDTTREALDGKDRDLHRTCRYLTVFPDHSSTVVPVSGLVPPQHYSHKRINKILKRCNLYDYHILLPPCTHAETPPLGYESSVTVNSILTKKQRSEFTTKIIKPRKCEDSELVGSKGIAKKRCKQFNYPVRTRKVGQYVRFNLPEAKEPLAKSTENTPQKAHKYLPCSYLSQAIQHKELHNYKECVVADEDVSQETESTLDKEIDDIEEGEENSLSCITDPYSFQLIHQRGKFVSPWNSNIDQNIFCSKSDASKRFHAMFPDIVPDQRDNYTFGKKVKFYGYNSSIFR